MDYSGYDSVRWALNSTNNVATFCLLQLLSLVRPRWEWVCFLQSQESCVLMNPKHQGPTLWIRFTRRARLPSVRQTRARLVCELDLRDRPHITYTSLFTVYIHNWRWKKGTTVKWLQYHGALRWRKTSQPTWHYNLDKKELKSRCLETFDFSKFLFFRCCCLFSVWSFSHFGRYLMTQSKDLDACRLQNMPYPLFYVLQLLYQTVVVLSTVRPCHTQATLPVYAQSRIPS